jgi:uncharacterized protein (TIGR02145 family)
MKENLKTTRYRNGVAIAGDLRWGDWANTTSGAYAIYCNIKANDAILGKLYNWYAVADNRGLCPSGWHVPSQAEFNTLTTFLGGNLVAGGKMKSIGTDYWNDPNTGATNSSGFTALPGGYHTNFGAFKVAKNIGCFWSTTDYFNVNAFSLYLLSNSGNSGGEINWDKHYGLSVRCLRDAQANPPTITTSAINNAILGGNVISDGGSPVTARGIVWSTAQNPTVDLTTKTSDGAGTGVFSSSLKGLKTGITYYLRAYATNEAGTNYGDQTLFTSQETTTAGSEYFSGASTAVGLPTESPKFGGGIQWQMFPNPTEGLLYLSINNLPINTSSNMSVHDSFGRAVRILKEIGHGTHKVDLSGLPSGIYMVNLMDSNGIYQGSQRVILR